MAKRPKPTIDIPPFPTLQWDDYFWTAPVVLKAWTGFQSRQGAYGSQDSVKPSCGSVHLSVAPPEGTQDAPTAAQAGAFQYLMDHEEPIRDSVLGAVLAWYPTMRPVYVESEEDAELMPEIEAIHELKNLIGLSTIHILPVIKGGIAYVGYEFGCTWDGEHGLGVMTHKDRVIEVGGADTSFLEWIAVDDAKK